MKIRCRNCGEFFNPEDETIELLSEGYISSENVNICDDCWDMFEHMHEELSEFQSDADMCL